MSKRIINVRTFSLTLIFILFVSSLASCASQHNAHTPATEQRFKDIDFWVRMFEDPARDKWQKPVEVVKAMNLKQGDVVADIGAGTGYFTRHFAVAVGPDGKSIGLDIEPGMVKYMQDDAKKLKLQNYEARVVRTDDPELAVKSVDVIFLCNTYHHIADRVRYFKHVSRSLNPAGRVIIVDFYKNTDFGPPREHKLAKEVVMSEMKGAGYRLDRDLEILDYQYYLEYVVK